MLISGTLLVAIIASFLKPLLSTNQSQHPATVYDQHNNGISPFEENEFSPDGAANYFVTLRLPRLLSSANADFDIKRQFDPWGGKRYSKVVTKDEDISRKRQFSPWGGKRSYSENLSFDANGNVYSDANSQADNTVLVDNIRDLNSLNVKKGFNSWGGKRDSNVNEVKEEFKSWSGKKNLKDRDEKRNFKPWGGKRFVKDLKESSDAYDLINNANLGGKRQTFHSWGGKRSSNVWDGKRGFNSWGGKRAFNSWGGKRSFNSWGGKRAENTRVDKRDFSSWGGKRAFYNPDSKLKELYDSSNDSIFSSNNNLETDRNMR